MARSLTRAEGFTIISELQAEAWFETTEGLEEIHSLQRLMYPPERIVTENVEYARRTQFSHVYLWGIEWWYWMAAHGHGEYLDTARALLSTASPGSPGSRGAQAPEKDAAMDPL